MDMLKAQRCGDLAAAAAHGATSVEHARAWSGIGDDFMHLWPAAVEAAIDAGDLDLARSLLSPVTTAPPGLVSPAVSALLLLVRGLIGAAGADTPSGVEADLRAAITALDAYGAIPMRARTQQALGEWLLGQGQVDEAAEILAAARATYQELGAAGWLARLGAPSHVSS